jgi:hypothetical protein
LSRSRFDPIKQKLEVNPVEIWEGIDTGEGRAGRNRLTKLAIHILSVVANSAGCERAFSHMGLVHTTIRSRLGIEKVRKATIVGMDLKRMHIEAGLLRGRSKRNFTSGSETGGQESQDESESAGDNLGDLEDPLDFDQLSAQLIAGAVSASADKDVGDAEDDAPQPPVPLTITVPPLNAAIRLATVPVKVSIPLRILFKYPTDAEPPSDGMNTFWNGGIRNLEKEMEAYELLNSAVTGEENTVETNPETPIIPGFM